MHDLAPKDSALRADLKTWHFMRGLSVLALVLVRLATRLFTEPSPLTAPVLSAWNQRLATWMHIALYVFMLGMPLLGWFVVSAKGDPIVFFGGTIANADWR